MALKFLNKKGWHTGSLRNIENVWKAEQKHENEQKKLEELRKQIHEERERSEFRLLQEQAGLVPHQERLDFLYDSGLAVGKGNSEGFKALEPKSNDAPSSSTSTSSKQQQESSAPGALFEDKPQSANDAWRKLHSDPLLMIRQREQEALARIKNNPVQMAMIKKSVETKKHKEKSHEVKDEKEHRKKHHHSSSKHKKYSSAREEDERRKSGHRKSSNRDKHSDSEDEYSRSRRKTSNHDKNSDSEDEYSQSRRKSSNHDKHSNSEDEYSRREVSRNGKSNSRVSRYREQSPGDWSGPETAKTSNRDDVKGNNYKSERENFSTQGQRESHNRRRYVAPKLSEEERAARLREMQMDAELHEEQRWKRLKKAEDDDAREASQAAISRGKNFLDAAHKSVYGAEKGGSTSIAESVRRRTHYSQGRSVEGNAFRR
ncbi:hypothetical protein UlMin_015774 [Ulmus minor]